MLIYRNIMRILRLVHAGRFIISYVDHEVVEGRDILDEFKYIFLALDKAANAGTSIYILEEEKQNA